MTYYLWVTMVLFALSGFAKLAWLAKGELPQRTATEEAIDVFFNAVFVAWAAVLLFSS